MRVQALLALAIAALTLIAAPAAAETNSKTGTECEPWKGRGEGYWNEQMQMVCAGSPPGGFGGAVFEIESTAPACRLCNLPDDRSLSGRIFNTVLDAVLPRAVGFRQLEHLRRRIPISAAGREDEKKPVDRRTECNALLSTIDGLEYAVKLRHPQLFRQLLYLASVRDRGAGEVADLLRSEIQELRAEIARLRKAFDKPDTRFTLHGVIDMSCDAVLGKNSGHLAP